MNTESKIKRRSFANQNYTLEMAIGELFNAYTEAAAGQPEMVDGFVSIMEGILLNYNSVAEIIAGKGLMNAAARQPEMLPMLKAKFEELFNVDYFTSQE